MPTPTPPDAPEVDLERFRVATDAELAGLEREDAALAPWRFWIVPHTHWDREWYLAFDDFRFRLVSLVDEVLDVLEADPAMRFTLDGQVVVLEDYLEVRPAARDRIARLVASNRLTVGPLYSLPDEYLVGQEGLLRNFAMGRRALSDLGMRPMSVCYEPDSFGHIAQFPQLLRGFGLDTMIFARGMGDEARTHGTAFTWRGHDGSEVLALPQVGSYFNAAALGFRVQNDEWFDEPDIEVRAERAFDQLRYLLDRYGYRMRLVGTRDVYVGDGMDHDPIEPRLSSVVATMATKRPHQSFQIATFEDYAAAVRASATPNQTMDGEMCGGLEENVLRGVNSTRMYLKQQDEAAERSLLEAEALASLAELARWRRAGADTAARQVAPAQLGSRLMRTPDAYPADELRIGWRELLRNAPHDSICGCSIDDVHDDMEARTRRIRTIARRASRDALAALADRPAEWTYQAPGSTCAPVEGAGELRTAINVLPWERTAVVELTGTAIASLEPGPGVQLVDDGDPRGVRALVAARVAGFGSRTVSVEGGAARDLQRTDPPVIAAAVATGEDTIENGLLRVRVGADGRFDLEDLVRGGTWSGLGELEDEGDRGDTYTFTPVPADSGWRSRDARDLRVRVVERGPARAAVEIRYTADLPTGLSDDRLSRADATTACPITTVVSLAAGSDRVDIRTTVENTARDHRLRAVFPSPDATDRVRAEGHFAVLDRPAVPYAGSGDWTEEPHPTHHTLGAVAAGSLATFTVGLPEYEARPRPTGGVDLLVTLLRCVGMLSAPNLPNRPRNAGPDFPTPGAQCLGTSVFEYAVAACGAASNTELVRRSRELRYPLVVGHGDGVVPEGVLAVDGDDVCWSALAAAEDGVGLVVRLYNVEDEPRTVHVHGADVVVRECRLDETGVGVDPVEDVVLRPGEIRTLRLLRA